MWLKWNAPYTLRGVEIDWYYVNVTISTLDTTSIQSFKTNVTKHSFQAVDNSSCTVYNVSIQAVTLAGLGQQASINTFRRQGNHQLFVNV